MFFLFGSRSKTSSFGQLQHQCPKCSRPTMHSMLMTKTWFTFFFVPVIPMPAGYLIHCNVCGFRRKASGDLRAQLESFRENGQLAAGAATAQAISPR